MIELVEKMIQSPRWAVVGASPKPERASNQIVHLLAERGYTVYPVRPATKEIDGIATYSTLDDLPEKPDVVDLVVNPAVGIETLRRMRDLGIKNAWVQPGAESDEIRTFAEENGITLVEACVLVVLKTRPNFRIA